MQTPTLAVVVQREEEINAFVPRTYWEVHATFECANGTYEAKWFDADFKKDPADEEAKAERRWTLDEAERIVRRCTGRPGQVTEVKKRTRPFSST